MFNLQHILYMLISGVITAALLILAAKFAKSNGSKSLILKSSAVITVLIHYSSLVVDFFENGGEALVENNHILPVYPCNIIMWMLLIFAFIEKKDSIPAKMLAEFCFIAGIVCGTVGIVFNINFDNNPTLADYHILKGLLSHSTMLFGCIYVGILRYVKFGMFNILSLTAGLLVFVSCGLVVDGLYSAFGMTPPDGIFIKEVPYVGISSIILGAALILVIFAVYALIELRLPKEERWYSKLADFFKTKKASKKEK